METLEQLYIPQLQQLKAKMVARDASRCFATFDGTVCDGEMIAVKADDYCLITRFHLKMNSDLELVEHHQRSLCIVEYSPNVASDYRGEDACCEKRCPRIVNVLARRGPGKKRMLKKGCCYEATCVTYLPEYFDAIDIPLIGDFDEISALIPSLEDGLITLHLKGLLEDLDLDTAQKPSGRYYFRSIALQALCQVMDMAYELNK
ncbi:MAG: hypothetical protein IJH87_02880, partial [Atopobiaceae bacterium]|nr:hypothetical protein [Atopobiaceae bacterium]